MSEGETGQNDRSWKKEEKILMKGAEQGNTRGYKTREQIRQGTTGKQRETRWARKTERK